MTSDELSVLHVIAGDLRGGAARGAFWLHEGLISNRVSSHVFTNSKVDGRALDITSVNTGRTGRLRCVASSQADSVLKAPYRKRRNVTFSTGATGFDFTKTEIYERADIVHLHWINSGLVNVRHLASVSKPIVWTLRDMWPFTGGCHYAFDCAGYEAACGNCPQLGSSIKYDLSRVIWKRKRRYFPNNIAVVGLSKWLSSEAKKSSLFKDNDVLTIPNCIDTEEFSPVDKLSARDALGIHTTKCVVLVGANNLEEFYKGFDKFRESLEFLEKSKYLLCFFGRFSGEGIADCGFEWRSLGYLSDTISLRLVYSCADVFVAPSIMEAFGKTIVESMSCGTPVVCFDATGPKDIVRHKIDGFKANPFEPAGLAEGIKWVNSYADAKELSLTVRTRATNEFDNRLVAKRYIQLYKKLLA
jgi:glycosyltransferase involved in cell wall biosynthesis